MTCIVGVVENGTVWLGADSAGASAETGQVEIRSDEKVFVRGPYAMGFTTSFRMGDLLRYSVVLPIPTEDERDLRGFMVIRFIDAVRDALNKGGFATKKDQVESGGNFLVGIRGHLFEIANDYQVAEVACQFAAVGSGWQLALGALHAGGSLPVKERIYKALEAAERFNAFVRRPFRIVSVDGRVEVIGNLHNTIRRRRR